MSSPVPLFENFTTLPMFLYTSAVMSYLFGHPSVVTTERYIDHTLAELAKAAAVLEDVACSTRTWSRRLETDTAGFSSGGNDQAGCALINRSSRVRGHT